MDMFVPWGFDILVIGYDLPYVLCTGTNVIQTHLYNYGVNL